MYLRVITFIGADNGEKTVSFDANKSKSEIHSYIEAHHDDDKVISEENINVGKYVDFKKELTIESAKQFLKDNGYFVDNLWSVLDVQKDFDCTREEAQTVLSDVLESDRIKQEINESIDIVASGFNLLKKNVKYFSICGHYKDDGIEFKNYIICEDENDNYQEKEESDIFFYGLNEQDIKKHIELGENTWLEFVITSYEETTLN